MDKVKKIGLFFIFLGFLFGIDSCAQPNQRGPRGNEGGMKPGGMLRGEVTDVRADEIIVNIYSGGVQNIKRTSELKVSKERRRTLQDIAIGQNIMVMGHQEVGQRYRAFIIRIISEETPAAGPPGMKGRGGPIQGKVTGITPLRVDTYEGNIEVDLSEVKNIFEETPAKADELKAGDNVILIGPQGRIMKIIIVDQPFPEQKKNREGGSVRNKKESERALPMPPVPKISLFKKESMDRKKDSPFGFKDPNMLRVDLFSWYEDYAHVMNDLGAYWMEPAASFGFAWAGIQKKNPDGTYAPYNWDRYDNLVRNAQAHNIHISAIIHASEPKPGIASRITPGLPHDLEAYKAFVRSVVERYDGDGKDDMPGLLYPINRWKVEDEPFSPLFFQGSGADYAVLLKNTHDAIKSANPEAVVICAMVYATHGPIGTRESDKFLIDFFSKLSEITKTRPYDIIDEHWIIVDSERKNKIKDQIVRVNEIASHYGFRPAPFESLEVGAASPDERTQAKNLIKQYAYGFALRLKKIFWSGIKAVSDSMLVKKGLKNDPFRGNTIINGDGTRRLAYYSYKKMVEILNNSDWNRAELVQEKEGIYIVKFHSGGLVWVVWNDSGESRTAKIKLPNNQAKVKITEAVPSKDHGRDVVDYKTAFRREVRQIQGGVLELTLDDDIPRFVEIL